MTDEHKKNLFDLLSRPTPLVLISRNLILCWSLQSLIWWENCLENEFDEMKGNKESKAFFLEQIILRKEPVVVRTCYIKYLTLYNSFTLFYLIAIELYARQWTRNAGRAKWRFLCQRTCIILTYLLILKTTASDKFSFEAVQYFSLYCTWRVILLYDIGIRKVVKFRHSRNFNFELDWIEQIWKYLETSFKCLTDFRLLNFSLISFFRSNQVHIKFRMFR